VDRGGDGDHVPIGGGFATSPWTQERIQEITNSPSTGNKDGRSRIHERGYRNNVRPGRTQGAIKEKTRQQAWSNVVLQILVRQRREGKKSTWSEVWTDSLLPEMSTLKR